MFTQKSAKRNLSRKTRPGLTVRPQLERLEDRCLPSFGTGGVVLTDFNRSSNEGANAVALQADGRIVAAGTSDNDFALARYTADGNLDASFDKDGKVTTPVRSNNSDIANALAIQPDGKIIAVGYSIPWASADYDFALVRYNSNGILDRTFGGNGKVNTALSTGSDIARGVAVQPWDGKIVVAGVAWNGVDYDFALVRYTSTGTLDSTFGTAGKVLTGIGPSHDVGNALAIQATPSGPKILVAGSAYFATLTDRDFALARYNLDGSLDAGFGSGGKVTTDFGGSDDIAWGMAVSGDGSKIALAGFSSVARYNADGSLDNTFDGDGKLTMAGVNARAVGLQADGKIVVGGRSINPVNGDFGSFAVTRYNPDGSLDSPFGIGGVAITDTTGTGDSDTAYGVAIQPDGKIVAAGWAKHTPSDFALVRYYANGHLDDGSLGLTAVSTATAPVAETLSQNQVQPLLTEAIARWQAAGVDTSSLANIQIQITNLGGTTLGMAAGHTIWLDDNAAGWGWFVDPTPGDDSEFTTPGNQGEQNRLDLLTVLAHEVGHLLGYDHEDDGVMADTLGAGTRLTSLANSSLDCLAAVDALFGEFSPRKRRP